MKGRGRPVHPILALQVVNQRTKAIDALLAQPMPSGKARALIRERAYLYELKHRAAGVLLRAGWLRPFGVSGTLLMVEGDAPDGRCQFHLPATLFAGDVARVGSGRDSPLPAVARQDMWWRPRSVEEGVAALTRIIARGSVG
ncbi:hypothetical protein [uncultured Deinococcus sp.]|uniref:hypothetical protein n=1 Tax=uncultured Deinococcus sp. TaxID=158789 RepID=UPI0025EE5A1C|nr:hypothetical protein [uncultured Deinococcus sp.]